LLRVRGPALRLTANPAMGIAGKANSIPGYVE
jgi:hypothetical protein